MGDVGGYAKVSDLAKFLFRLATIPLTTDAKANITIGKIIANGKLDLSIKEPINILAKIITV